MPRPLRSCLWVVVVAAALTCITWSATQRARHIAQISRIGIGPEAAAKNAATRPLLIVPERINAAYAWLAETRQMFARHQIRVRHIDYENAPYGRDLAAASPYRWWLGVVAAGDRLIARDSTDRAIDRAALIADPLLAALALILLGVFVAKRLGLVASAAAVIGLATLYPLAVSFLPGVPSDRGMIVATSMATVLCLVIGATSTNSAQTRRWFVAAGFAAGFALWLNPAHAVALIGGLFVAAPVASRLRRSRAVVAATAVTPLPWRAWSIAGAAVTLLGYLVEYFPGHLGGWELRAIHPLYGVVWLSAGEVVAQMSAAIESRHVRRDARAVAGMIVGILGIASFGVAIWKTHQSRFLADDLSAFRLADIPGAPAARSFGALMQQDSNSLTVALLLIPLLLLAGAVVAIFVGRLTTERRTALAIAAIPTLATVVFAWLRLAWWSDAEALLVATVATTAYAMRDIRFAPAFLLATTIGLCAPGLILAWPTTAETSEQPSENEVLALVDRDLASWLSRHSSTAPIFIAPPNDTVALSYYGGGRGLGTLSWQNKAGLEAAVRILSASTPEEAKALIERRGITQLIMPSWDPYLDEYARMGMGQLDGTFLQRLHEWRVPGWLRPVPYALPRIPGFERQAVTIFEVVEEQSDALALSRTAEYFLELQRLPEASAVAQHLRRFPADMNAWVARAEVETATGDEETLKKSLNILLPYLQAKRDRSLPWDLRVGLAVVLARAKHPELAKPQVQRCVADATEERLRGLSTGALYRLLVLARAYETPILDARLAQLARELLPPEAQARL